MITSCVNKHCPPDKKQAFLETLAPARRGTVAEQRLAVDNVLKEFAAARASVMAHVAKAVPAPKKASTGGLKNLLKIKSSEVPKFATKSEMLAYKADLRAKGYDGIYLTDQQKPVSLTPKGATGETVASVTADVKAFLGTGYDNLVKRGKLEIVQSKDAADMAGAPLRGASGKVAGVYRTKQKKIFLIADNIEKGDGRYIMTHEGGHALLREDKVFMKQKDKIISDFIALADTTESVRVAIARVPKSTPEAVKDEEALMHWLQNKANHDFSPAREAKTGKRAVAQARALYRRVMSAIKAALYRLGIAHGKLTEQELVSLFTQGVKAYAKQTEKQSVTAKVNEFAQPAMMSVREAARKIQGLAAFKKWFGDSKAVDKGGNPEVYYHGTVKSFTEFIPKYNKKEQLGFGVHFTKDKAFADLYAEDPSVMRKGVQEPRTIPVFLKAENPLYADIIAKEGTPEYNLAYKVAGKTHKYLFMPDYADDMTKLETKIVYLRSALDAGSPQVVEKYLRELGYDSVFYTATMHGGAINGIVQGGVKKADSVVILEPTSIKSIFNDGTWDGTNPDIMMSATEDPEALFSQVSDRLKAGQATLKTAISALASPKSKLHDLYVQHAPKWLSVTPLNTLVQTFGKTIPQIRSFSKNLDEVVSTKTEIVDTSAVLYEQTESLAKKTVGVDVFNRAAATASFNRMTPWLGLYEQDWIPQGGAVRDQIKNANASWSRSGMRKATGMSFTEAYNQSRKAYEALGSEDLKDAYQKVVAHIASVRTRERNNLLTYIEQVSDDGTAARKELMDKFNASFSNLYGAYWPLARNGDFILEYTDTEGFRTVKQFTTIAERNEAKAAAIAEGVEAKTIKEDYKNKQPGGAIAIPQQLLDQLNTSVKAKYLEGVDPKNAEATAAALDRAQETINDMTQIWLRWQPETSALKNSVRRKNVKGFDADMLRSYLGYMQRHASSIAWTEQGRKIEQDIKSLSDDIAETKKGEEAVDVTMQRHILNDLRNRVQALRSVSVGPAASALGKLGTGWYMTSPSIALVQMSQLGVLTYPKLATMFGIGKATKALASGTKDAFSKKFTRGPMFEDPAVKVVYENLRAVVTDENRNTSQAKGKQLGDRMFTNQEILAQVRKLDPEQVKLLVLRESMARNLLDISAAHEAYELTRGKDPKNLRSKIFNLAMMPMSLSELASRKATVLATLELAQGQGKDFFAAMNDIGEVVNDTLYSYAKENKGSALQGGVSRVLLQFQHYRIMTGIRLALLLRNTIKGETKEVRRAATKEFVGIMGMTGALAGTLGVPMASATMAILGLVLGDDDEPYDAELEFTNWLTENFGETTAGVAMKGLPTLVGTDLSRRLGMGDLYGFQSQPPSNLHGRELAAWWAANQLGPTFSVGQGFVQGYDEIVNKGNYMRGLEAATPKPIKDVLKSIRVASDGLKNSAGKKLLADEAIGPDDIAMLALGFNPSEISKAQGAERSLVKLSTKLSERRGKLVKAAAKAIVESEDTTEAMDAIRTFNSKLPLFAITGSDITPAVRKILLGELGTTGVRQQQVARQYEIPVYSGG